MKSKGNPSKTPGKSALVITLFGILIILGLVAATWFVLMQTVNREVEKQNETDFAAISTTGDDRKASEQQAMPVPAIIPDVQALIAGTGQKILENPGDSAVSFLAGLRQDLLALPALQVSEVIREYMTSGTETVPTGVLFKLNANGRLIGAPSLKLFLLDVWNQVDPLAAADFARSRLTNYENPDEWAIHMRNFGMLAKNSEDRTWLQEQLEHFLGESRWRQDPSIGYLHSFDGMVALGDPESVIWINNFLDEKNKVPDAGNAANARAVNHAAFLALDQLIINDPGNYLPVLYQSLEEKPETITSMHLGLLARADIRDSRGSYLLEDFLLNDEISREKKEALLRLYPNTQYYRMVNLLTTSSPESTGIPVATGDSILQDAKTLEQVEIWLNDERFAAFRPALEDLRRKLTRMIREGND